MEGTARVGLLAILPRDGTTDDGDIAAVVVGESRPQANGNVSSLQALGFSTFRCWKDPFWIVEHPAC